MQNRTVLLVGSHFDAGVSALVAADFKVVTALNPADASDLFRGAFPAVVVIDAPDPETTIRWLHSANAMRRDEPIPIMVVQSPRSRVSREVLLSEGAWDCVVWNDDDDGGEVVAHLHLLLMIRQLAETVVNQKAIIGRHVERVLESVDTLRRVRAELEGLMERGSPITYSAEAAPTPGSFSSAEELELASLTHVYGAVHAMLGYEAQDMLGHPWGWGALIPQRDRKNLRERARCLFERGRCTCEFRIRHADGRIRWVRDEAHVLRRNDGARVLVAGRLCDITRERKFAAAFGRKVNILQVALRLRGVQQLAGTLAHDLNNMLAVVICHAQLAARNMPSQEPAQKSLDCIVEAMVRVKNGTKLLERLARRNDFGPVRVNINALVRHTIKLVAPLLGESIPVVTELRPNPPRVLVHRGDLEHALIHLCLNARDAMPCGGVLSIRTEVECDRTDPKAPPKVVIEVSDDGLGMEQCVFNRCFDPLFTTKHQGGECAGLGLYSVWQTVHDAGGDVRVETTVGSGTKFRIVLPAAQNVVATSPRTNVRDEAGRHETGNQALKLAVL